MIPKTYTSTICIDIMIDLDDEQDVEETIIKHFIKDGTEIIKKFQSGEFTNIRCTNIRQIGPQKIPYHPRLIENLEFYNYLSAYIENNMTYEAEDQEDLIQALWMEMKDDPDHELWTYEE